ncbi:MAG: excisionase [Candidatus Limivicinus sp.]|jgi:hypothetical protein
MEEIPVWEKSNLTIDEASAYFNIGSNRLRTVLDSKECQNCVLWVGSKRLVKRVLFQDYLNSTYSI